MALAALVTGVVTWALKPETYVSVVILIPAALVLFICIATLCRTVQLLQLSLDAKGPTLPRVITARRHYEDGSGLPMLLLEASPFFAPQTYVSVYHLDHSGFEVLIGIGLVTSIQGNGLIPVRLERWASSKTALLTLALSCAPSALAELLVKPSVPIDSPLSDQLLETNYDTQ